MKVELRAITRNQRIFDNPVMMSSLIPSARNSCSGSADMLLKGSTAMESRSRVPEAAFAGASPPSQRQTRSGPSMFFILISPASMKVTPTLPRIWLWT